MIKKQTYLEENEFPTLLDTDVVFSGDIETQDDSLVKGTITESKVKAALLVVSKEGEISGTLNINHVSLLGQCSGNIHIYDTLTILEGGHISGKLRINTLVVHAGGIMNCECHTTPMVSIAKEA